MKQRKASVADITQWRLWRQWQYAKDTGETVRDGVRHHNHNFPIYPPAGSREQKLEGPAKVISFAAFRELKLSNLKSEIVLDGLSPEFFAAAEGRLIALIEERRNSRKQLAALKVRKGGKR